MPDALCTCGSAQTYASCCGRFIEGDVLPETPEQLMRSRYTAYTQANVDYIEATMRGPAARGYDKEAARRWASSVVWQGLVVRATSCQERTGEVEFEASFLENGQIKKICERSRFERVDDKWYYVDQVRQGKVGRNDPCPCGSHKKYKKCCG